VYLRVICYLLPQGESFLLSLPRIPKRRVLLSPSFPLPFGPFSARHPPLAAHPPTPPRRPASVIAMQMCGWRYKPRTRLRPRLYSRRDIPMYRDNASRLRLVRCPTPRPRPSGIYAGSPSTSRENVATLIEFHSVPVAFRGPPLSRKHLLHFVLVFNALAHIAMHGGCFTRGRLRVIPRVENPR